MQISEIAVTERAGNRNKPVDRRLCALDVLKIFWLRSRVKEHSWLKIVLCRIRILSFNALIVINVI